MADKRKRPTAAAKAKARAEPSVTAFLSRITGRPTSITTAGLTVQSLLGEVVVDDLRRAGRGVVEGPRSTDPVPTTPAPQVRCEISTPPTAADRREIRRQTRTPVEIRGVFHPPGAPPIASNLSIGGVFVETGSPLDVGDPVVVAFPTGGDGAFSVNGRVRWVTPFGRLDDARPGMGIEFVGVDGFKRARLKDLLERRAQDDAS
jgi:Tfp pilus assembly protein PilZ